MIGENLPLRKAYGSENSSPQLVQPSSYKTKNLNKFFLTDKRRLKIWLLNGYKILTII
jgi:hypothetical protein